MIKTQGHINKEEVIKIHSNYKIQNEEFEKRGAAPEAKVKYLELCLTSIMEIVQVA